MGSRKGFIALESLGTFDRLYHYASSEFSELQTPRYRGGTDPKKIKRAEELAKKYKLAGAYCDHISFFFEPIPLDILGKLFGKDHAVWFSGSKLYQHVVTLDDLGDCPYEVVETPTQNKVADQFDWTNEAERDKTMAEYVKLQNRAKLLNGEIGYDKKTLHEQIAKFRGGTRAAYIAASESEDFEDGRNKYAAGVPHLMAYPLSGKVRVDSVSKVVVK